MVATLGCAFVLAFFYFLGCAWIADKRMVRDMHLLQLPAPDTKTAFSILAYCDAWDDYERMGCLKFWMPWRRPGQAEYLRALGLITRKVYDPVDTPAICAMWWART